MRAVKTVMTPRVKSMSGRTDDMKAPLCLRTGLALAEGDGAVVVVAATEVAATVVKEASEGEAIGEAEEEGAATGAATGALQ